MKKIYTIGRDTGCDVVIPDETNVISRLHATLRIDDKGKYYLIDQSRNGTYVNGMKMSSNVEIPVTRKDVISFAHIHNLDWTLIPRGGNPLVKTMLLMLCGLVVLAGIGYGVWFFMKQTANKVEPSVKKPESVPAPAIPESQPIVKSDTVVVYDTVRVTREEPKKREEKKDTIKTESEPEVIQNPIY